MFELRPIDAAASPLGLASGVVAVPRRATGAGRLSLRSLMGIVALAAINSCLIAAKPAAWEATARPWSMTAPVMPAIDPIVVCLVVTSASDRTVRPPHDR